MRFSTALALASAPLAAFAANQTVMVGADDKLMFFPSNITAAQGDFVEFKFMSKNHTATQSTFASPCTKAPSGVNSGFLATPSGSTPTNDSAPTWTIQIQNASAPLWFYCAQKTPVVHCNMGMVFSINETPQKSFAMFQAAAMAAANSTSSASGDAASGAAAPSSGAASASSSSPSDGSSGSASSGSASSGSASSSSDASGAAAAGASGTQDASNSAATTSGASRITFKRGAAGLLTMAAVGAVLL